MAGRQSLTSCVPPWKWKFSQPSAAKLILSPGHSHSTAPPPEKKAKPLSFSIPIFHTIVQMKPLWNRPHLSQELSAPTTTCISPSYKLYYRCSHPFSNQPISILRARHVTCSSMYLQHLAQGRMSGGWEAFRYPPLFQAESSRSMVLPIWGYDHLP